MLRTAPPGGQPPSLHLLRAIDIQKLRDHRSRVPEHILDVFNRHPKLIQQRGARVPQIMEPDPPEDRNAPTTADLHADQDDLQGIDQHAQEAAARGADYISMRRLSELIGATTLDAYADLGNRIATDRPRR